MTPEPARSHKSDLPGALSSPSTPEESEAFWRDIGRWHEDIYWDLVRRYGEQIGSCLPKEDDDG